MADPNLATKFFEQLLEPSRPATALEPYYHPLPGKLSVEAAYFFRLRVVQLQPFYLSLFSCQITDRLLASMKVDPDIYCHRRLLLLTQIVSTVSLSTNGRRRLLHTINPDPGFNPSMERKFSVHLKTQRQHSPWWPRKSPGE